MSLLKIEYGKVTYLINPDKIACWEYNPNYSETKPAIFLCWMTESDSYDLKIIGEKATKLFHYMESQATTI